MLLKYFIIYSIIIYFSFYSPSLILSNPQQSSALIFCFHDINGRGRYSTTKSELIQIFNLFKDKYQMLSLKAWYKLQKTQKASLTLVKPPPKPTVILTFDDGFLSLFEIVVPLLKKYQYQATFFIYLNRHNSSSLFYKKLAKLQNNFEIGSHSFTHDKLSAKSQNIFKELYLSKKKLESIIRKKIISWAWPYGYYTIDLLEQARHAGYILQVSTDYSLVKPGNNYENMSRYTIQRPKPVQRVKNILKHYDQYLLKVNTENRVKQQK